MPSQAKSYVDTLIKQGRIKKEGNGSISYNSAIKAKNLTFYTKVNG